MGKQSRLKHLRREARLANAPRAAVLGEPLRLLRGIHRTIQGHCSENGRRCWEYLLEMLAQSSGWDTETAEARPLWDKMQNESRWTEFFECWNSEVAHAKANGAPFSEPIGDLLEEIEGTNDHLGQFFTPMAVVRMMNAIMFSDLEAGPTRPDGFPTHRGLDPCCGTGRFILDALVHNDNLVMHGVDLDVWMLRAAMVNVRMLAKWSSLRLHDPNDVLKPLRNARHAINRLITNSHPIADHDEGIAKYIPDGAAGDILVIGGRSIFMHGNALIVDLDYTPNWLCGGWAWTPLPWSWNLKMARYYGSYDDWQKAGCPNLDELARAEKTTMQFDYSMRPTPPPP